ncbi:MAG: NAD(P)-dependent oxidoreductase, partial [Holophagales bacterium]|nr:NAD(P)-dependent oxidoreductase [Holophagales bacterium]
TGGTGFIGRHVARRLSDAGARVLATTRGAPPTSEPHPGSDLPAGLRWRSLDLADPGAVVELFESVRPEVVLHLASHVAGSRDLDLVAPTLAGNLLSTVHLLTAAEKVGGVRRFVQVGSLEEPDDGESAPVPSSPYAAAKAAAAAYARMFHLLYGTPVVIARVFMVYGPGAQDEKKLVPYVIRTLLDGGEPRLSSGARPVDWVYVGDVAEGLLRLATTPGLEGRRIDLGSGVSTPVRRVVEALYHRLAPGRVPVFGSLGDRKAEQVRLADLEATRDTLGWAPSVGLDEGLDRTVEYFR